MWWVRYRSILCSINSNWNFTCCGAQFLVQTSICSNPHVIFCDLHLQQNMRHLSVSVSLLVYRSTNAEFYSICIKCDIVGASRKPKARAWIGMKEDLTQFCFKTGYLLHQSWRKFHIQPLQKNKIATLHSSYQPIKSDFYHIYSNTRWGLFLKFGT